MELVPEKVEKINISQSELTSLQTGQISLKDLAIQKSGASRELAYKKIVDMCTAEVMTLDKYGTEHFAPDNSTQLRASELILKINGDLKDGNVVDNRVVNISGVSAEIVGELVNMVKDVAEQLRMLRVGGQQTGEIIELEDADDDEAEISDGN